MKERETTRPEVMTVAEAARYLRVCETKVRDWIKDGTIPAMTGGAVRIHRAGLDRLMGGDRRLYTQAEVDRAVEEARAGERARLVEKLIQVVTDAKLDQFDRKIREAA